MRRIRDQIHAKLNLEMAATDEMVSIARKIKPEMAMLVPEATTHEAVLQTVRQTKPANLESVELFDVFRGQHVPAGQKSLAYAFTYRSPEKTLTDAEVSAAHEKLLAQFKQTLGATMR